MGVGAVLEPLVVVTLLFGGTWFNRNTYYQIWARRNSKHRSRRDSHESVDSVESGLNSPSSADGLLERQNSWPLPVHQEPKWRRRQLRCLGVSVQVTSPNTRRFKEYFLSRLLRKFPFLVEAWYWALIYWVYQVGRAIGALTLVEGTVNVARHHALQVIHLEQRLNLFFERDIQKAFMKHPVLMTWTNRIYSFIHIPGTILFLVWLYWYTTVRPQRVSSSEPRSPTSPRIRRDSNAGRPGTELSEQEIRPVTAGLYQARRRTMAVCNLLAFIIFTAWPCMPPRLLSDKSVEGAVGDEARSYGFVDTVHGDGGESSVWTQNKFCNQYAAMPSLHFGYSLLIGLTILTIPLPPSQKRRLHLSRRRSVPLPSAARIATTTIGIAYPLIILLAIIATANHFVLDAVAGALVCGAAWFGNGILLNLLPLEDYFLWLVRIHKPPVDNWATGVDEIEEINVRAGKL